LLLTTVNGSEICLTAAFRSVEGESPFDIHQPWVTGEGIDLEICLLE